MAKRQKRGESTREDPKGAERQQQVNRVLSAAYYDVTSGVGFSGLNALQRFGKEQGILPHETRKWLLKQKHYKKFIPVRKKFKRRKTYVDGLDEQWQGDLIDLQKYAKENKGYRYILICIDILSRYMFAEPLKSKYYRDVLKGFRNMTKRAGRQPLLLQTDEGSEFVGAHFQALLKHMDIRHFYTHQNVKAAIVERAIRSLMGRMWQAMDYRGNHKWVDLLPQAVKGYNNRVHRSIGIPPSKVSIDNSRDVWQYLFGRHKEEVPKESDQPVISNAEVIEEHKELKREKKKKVIKPLLKKGDRVWVTDKKINKNAFEKGYKSKWRTEDTYLIRKVLSKTQPFTYRLSNSQGELVPGQFYQEQLQRIPEE